MKIALLLTGNELMSGDTVDSNSAYISQSLKDLGLMPYIKQVVGDDVSLLMQSIEQLSAKSDVLIINGGLGPTIDDMTAQSLAKVVDSPLQQHPQALAELTAWAQRTGFELTAANLKQADLPVGSDIILNPHGSAVGISYQYKQCLILCTPGVPYEMKPMVDEQILPLLAKNTTQAQKRQITRLRLFGIAESVLQEKVDSIWPEWPINVELGFRVQLPVLEVKIVTQGELSELNFHWVNEFRKQFGDYIIGDNDTRLPQALNQALLSKNMKITTAESCTGGLIASQITSEAGSSAVFEAGFVTYSNAIKQSVLGVQNETLTSFGAVSEQVVREMTKGALQTSMADIAVAISGIAGPDGGSDEKPVGTVWISWGTAQEIKAKKYHIPFERLKFQMFATAIAIDLLRREVLGLPNDVNYFERKS